MVGSGTLFWDLFEDWSPWMFFIAGIAWLLTALFNAFSDLVPVIVLILLTEAGSIALSASLVGFYPRLRDHAPRLALGGVICVGFVLVALLVFPLALLGVSIPLGAPPARLPNIGIAGGAVSIAGLIFILPIGSILFGAAILRTRELPETLGYLLLALAVPWLVIVVHVLLSTPRAPDWLRWFVVSVLALGIGYLLRTR